MENLKQVELALRFDLKWHRYYKNGTSTIRKNMSDRCYNAKWAIFQVYHGMKKNYFDEMIMSAS